MYPPARVLLEPFFSFFLIKSCKIEPFGCDVAIDHKTNAVVLETLLVADSKAQRVHTRPTPHPTKSRQSSPSQQVHLYRNCILEIRNNKTIIDSAMVPLPQLQPHLFVT